MNVPARTTLLTEGEVSTKAYIIEKGAIRAYFNHNGEEITPRFFSRTKVSLLSKAFKKSIPVGFHWKRSKPQHIMVDRQKRYRLDTGDYGDRTDPDYCNRRPAGSVCSTTWIISYPLSAIPRSSVTCSCWNIRPISLSACRSTILLHTWASAAFT